MAQTILIIDDDIDTLKLVGIMLERKGFRILASTTGEKGLQLVNKEYPDLVLLDVMIPDINFSIKIVGEMCNWGCGWIISGIVGV